MVQRGVIDVHAEPVLVDSVGVLERWDGRLGPGNLNAHACMERAITLARTNGMGCVALRNTNHWMRGGSYGWQAAEAGFVGLCWTNTMPNLPPWGARECKVGNNPVIIAVPRPEGHVVLDMAMSQFSYGALAQYRRRGESLPVDRGALMPHGGAHPVRGFNVRRELSVFVSGSKNPHTGTDLRREVVNEYSKEEF